LFLGAGEEGRPPVKAQFFVGEIEREFNGDVRVEGYLFDTQAEARFFIEGRLKRAINRILTLTLGEFRAKEQHSNKPGSPH